MKPFTDETLSTGSVTARWSSPIRSANGAFGSVSMSIQKIGVCAATSRFARRPTIFACTSAIAFSYVASVADGSVMCVFESAASGIGAAASISGPISPPALISIVATRTLTVGAALTSVFAFTYLFTATTAKSPTSTAATTASFV